MIHSQRKKISIHYCNICGSKVTVGVPEGDNRERHVCHACGHIQYQNPKVVVGSIVAHEQKLLLCKRAIQPRLGYWTIPAGFLETRETIEQGAIRETWEEAQANITNLHLYQITNIPRIAQIYIIYRAQLAKPFSFGAGPESLDVELVDEAMIPWNDMAFTVISKTLARYLKEQASRTFTMSVDTLG